MYEEDSSGVSEQSTLQTNQALYMNPTFVQLRLDPTSLHQEIEFFLGAKQLVEKVDGEHIYSEAVTMGKPLANEQGVASIMNAIKMRINPQVVQGNFDKDSFINYLYFFRKELAAQVVLNCYEWDIDDTKLEYIIDNICGMVEPFMSRLINNKERESFMNQLQSREIVDNRRGGSMVGKFAEGFGRSA